MNPTFIIYPSCRTFLNAPEVRVMNKLNTIRPTAVHAPIGQVSMPKHIIEQMELF